MIVFSFSLHLKNQVHAPRRSGRPPRYHNKLFTLRRNGFLPLHLKTFVMRFAVGNGGLRLKNQVHAPCRSGRPPRYHNKLFTLRRWVLAHSTTFVITFAGDRPPRYHKQVVYAAPERVFTASPQEPSSCALRSAVGRLRLKNLVHAPCRSGRPPRYHKQVVYAAPDGDSRLATTTSCLRCAGTGFYRFTSRHSSCALRSIMGGLRLKNKFMRLAKKN